MDNEQHETDNATEEIYGLGLAHGIVYGLALEGIVIAVIYLITRII